MLNWIFDPAPPSGAQKGGLADAQVIKADLDKFVREVLQNACDQRVGDETITVKLTLHELVGSEKAAFLAGMSWDDLDGHISGAKESGGVTIGPQLERAVNEALSAAPLRVLTIEDSGTAGLTGPEIGRDGNFNALCRHTLVTSQSDKYRGGSFGIGKSVLWRFSRFSTVIFSSRIAADPREGLRLLGRTELPSHYADGRSWDGPGWFGVTTKVEGGERAESAWDKDAEDTAHACLIQRAPQVGSGTSIAVVGFFEPELAEQAPLRTLAVALTESASRWFWPRLSSTSPSLRVIVRAIDDGEETYSQAVEVDHDAEPFVLARDATVVVEKVKEPGDIAERRLPFRVPARRSAGADPGHDSFSTDVILRVRLAGSQNTGENSNRVALIRGSGMVIDYRSPRKRSLMDTAFHAVLLAGQAAGTDEGCSNAEVFFRACEPPSHTEWTSGTQRVNAEYLPGAMTNLNALWASIEDALRDMVKPEEETDVSQGPSRLMAMFPVSGRGGGQTDAAGYRVLNLEAHITDGRWHVKGRVRRLVADGKPWALHVKTYLDAESGTGTTLPLARLAASPGDPIVEGKSRKVVIPAGTREADFTAVTEVPDGIAVGRASLRVRVDVT